jgi:hypothetical protein
MLIRESLDHAGDRNASRDKSQSLMKRSCKTRADSESRILFLANNSSNRRWVQLIKLSDFSLAICTCFISAIRHVVRNSCLIKRLRVSGLSDSLHQY